MLVIWTSALSWLLLFLRSSLHFSPFGLIYLSLVLNCKSFLVWHISLLSSFLLRLLVSSESVWLLCRWLLSLFSAFGTHTVLVLASCQILDQITIHDLSSWSLSLHLVCIHVYLCSSWFFFTIFRALVLPVLKKLLHFELSLVMSFLFFLEFSTSFSW